VRVWHLWKREVKWSRGRADALRFSAAGRESERGGGGIA
jgi:hypothetical protein